MSRLKTSSLLTLLIGLSQTATALGLRHRFVFLHAPALPRLLLMIVLASGLLALLFRRGRSLGQSESIALVVGTAGGLANLIDIMLMGAVADFIPVAPGALASPGDFLIAAGFMGFLPLSLRQARRGRGFFTVYSAYRTQVWKHLRERSPQQLPGS